jgi:choline-sulfatase
MGVGQSRVSLLVGKMATDVKIFGNSDKLNADTYTMADAFAGAGYTVEWVGKEHWLTKGQELGFGDLNARAQVEERKRCDAAKTFKNEIGRLPNAAAVAPYDKKNSTDYVDTEYAVKFLQEQSRNSKPFFLGVSLRRPHFPFEVQQEYFDLYKGKLTRNPKVTQAMLDDLCVSSQKERAKYKFSALTDGQIQKAREMYYGMVSYVDEMLGMVLDELDKQGLRENTIILYTSDHGELLGEHGLWYKNSFYEGSVRVPFIWSYPKALPKGRAIDAHVMNMDIFPTLREMCNLTVPDNLDGSSLLNLMQGNEDGKDRMAISENYRGNAGAFMVRKGAWKYCWYENSKAQLYNLTGDPEEGYNLIDEPRYSDLVKELHAIVMENYVEKPKVKK